MTQEQLQYIIDSDLPNYKKSQMIKDLYDLEHKDVTMFQKGGNLTEDQKAGREPVEIDGKQYYLNGNGKTIPASALERHPEQRGQQVGASNQINATETITVGGQDFDVEVADTPEKRKEGLSKVTNIEEGEGMLFIFNEPTTSYFTMKDTSIDLDIIFIDQEGEVIQVVTAKAHSGEPIKCVDPYQFVLETAPNSGVKEGDELEQDDAELDDEEKEAISKSKMLVLDSNGDVQMKLEGGERIVSRIKTRQLIKAALKAYKSDNDSDYKRVGRIILKELNAQDSRDAEYVEK